MCSGEVTSHALLAQHGLAPQLLARFRNGLIYRFIRGQSCTPTDLSREPTWRGVAQLIAKWHAVLPIISDGRNAVVKDDVHVPLAQSPLLPSDARNKINAIAPEKPVPNIWTVMQKWIFALPTSTKAEISRKSMLQQELERSSAELSNVPGLGGNGVRSAPSMAMQGLNGLIRLLARLRSLRLAER